RGRNRRLWPERDDRSSDIPHEKCEKIKRSLLAHDLHVGLLTETASLSSFLGRSARTLRDLPQSRWYRGCRLRRMGYPAGGTPGVCCGALLSKTKQGCCAADDRRGGDGESAS